MRLSSSLQCFSSIAFLLLVSLTPACTKHPESEQQAGIQQLNTIPMEQLRLFLKGYPGDWRPDSDRERGLPEPPRKKPVGANSKQIALVPSEFFQIGSKGIRETIAKRRSIRSFSIEPLTLEELSYLLWSTQGITGAEKNESGEIASQFRAAPSGGARYPLETYLAVNRVTGLSPGMYRYLPEEHQLVLVREETSLPATLQKACYGQEFVAAAPVVFIWSAVPYRTEWKYAYTAHRMIAAEAGHVCQNLYLAAESFGAGACALMGYHQPVLDQLIEVDGKDEFVIYLACVGRPGNTLP